MSEDTTASLPPERRAELVERVRNHWSTRHHLLSSDELAVWAIDALAPELAERDSLVAALRRYGQHTAYCHHYMMVDPVNVPCRCGFQAVLNGISK